MFQFNTVRIFLREKIDYQLRSKKRPRNRCWKEEMKETIGGRKVNLSWGDGSVGGDRVLF